MIEYVKNTSWRAFLVWRRNCDVYLVTWTTNLLPPLLEPVLYLVAFGLGIGALIKQVSYEGQWVSYSQFIAPGLLATQVMFQSFFENTYGSFVRMYYQKTFDAVLATPLSFEDIMVGELLWGTTKGVFGCTAMMIAITLFGLLHYPSSLFIVPWALLAGLFFSSLALCCTAVTQYIDRFNLPIFLFIMPKFLFSGTFFPLSTLPHWAQYLAQGIPLTHVVTVMRALSLGNFSLSHLWSVAYLLFLSPFLLFLSIHLMKKRMIR
jgi:lipooligosaccharide transport system permease protein